MRQHRRPKRIRQRIRRSEIRAENLRVLDLAWEGLFVREGMLLRRRRGWDWIRGRAGHVFHSSADDGFKGVAVFLHAWCPLSHDEEGGGAGTEVVGDGECPERGGEEETVAVCG